MSIIDSEMGIDNNNLPERGSVVKKKGKSKAPVESNEEAGLIEIHAQTCQLILTMVRGASCPIFHPIMHLYERDLDMLDTGYKPLAMSCIWRNLSTVGRLRGTPTPIIHTCAIQKYIIMLEGVICHSKIHNNVRGGLKRAIGGTT